MVMRLRNQSIDEILVMILDDQIRDELIHEMMIHLVECE